MFMNPIQINSSSYDFHSSRTNSIMENMIKQTRVKFAGVEEIHEGETSHVQERKSPTQKTRSFKGDSRRGQNWHRGQSSREPTYDYDSDYMESDEFRTAVAAAAFAIDSVEERRRTRRRRDGGLSKPKTKQEDDGGLSRPKTKQEDGGAGSTSRRIKERMPSSSAASNKMKNKEVDTVPISTPSFLSRKFSELQEKMPQRANSPANTGLKPESNLPSSSNDTKPTNTITQTGISEVNKRRSEVRPEDIKAEVWEKTEMERIKDRYERLNAKILEWENEKKAKAQKKLSRNKDDESEKKRARALRNYKTDMEMIEQIAEGARSQAEENRRKEVIKVKKKADTIRLTGEIPRKACLCF